MDLAEELFSLFQGNEGAHGTYDLTNAGGTGKQKGQARTLREPVTVEHWKQHLAGEYGLGIIPIRVDGTCFWGGMDVDVYNLDHGKLVTTLGKMKLPFLVCRSKSGGAHILLFFKEPVRAKILKEKLDELAAALGYGGTETFPKQTQLLVERGDVGNWLNMPYFGGDRTVRYAVDESGKAISGAEFLKRAKLLRLTEKELAGLTPAVVGSAFTDGPPCLQHIASQGVPEGTRNSVLFNMGVYLRKSRPDTWRDAIHEHNDYFLDPPLPITEVLSVIGSVDRKDYAYTCKQAPICNSCNLGVCRTRKFGVGNIGGSGPTMPTVSGLSKLDSRPPVWFLDVGENRVEMMTEDLQNQERFQRICMNELNMMTPQMNRAAWQQLVQSLMQNVVIIEASEDSSTFGQLWEMVERFCTQRAQGKQMSEVLSGKPFTEDGRTHFRLTDLITFLDRNHFKEFKVHQIAAFLRRKGGKHHLDRLKGKATNYWSVPEFKIQEGGHDLPDGLSKTGTEF